MKVDSARAALARTKAAQRLAHDYRLRVAMDTPADLALQRAAVALEEAKANIKRAIAFVEARPLRESEKQRTQTEHTEGAA